MCSHEKQVSVGQPRITLFAPSVSFCPPFLFIIHALSRWLNRRSAKVMFSFNITNQSVNQDSTQLIKERVIPLKTLRWLQNTFKTRLSSSEVSKSPDDEQIHQVSESTT